MTDTPNQEVAATLKWLRTTAQDGIDKAGPFLSEQTPLYVEELIRWQITLGILMPVMLVLWAGLFAIMARICYDQSEESSDGWDILFAISATIGVVGAGGFLVSSIVNGYSALQAWLAPRVFIANHFAEMIQ